MPDPTSFPVLEQSSGSYFGTLRDDFGALIPAADLLTLLLSLYVVKADGNLQIVNLRNRQNVLNANNVTVFNALQTLTDGRQYNLRFNYQPADTTLVETLAVERHVMLFEWTTAQVTGGKHEAVLAVENLLLVE